MNEPTRSIWVFDIPSSKPELADEVRAALKGMKRQGVRTLAPTRTSTVEVVRAAVDMSAETQLHLAIPEDAYKHLTVTPDWGSASAR